MVSGQGAKARMAHHQIKAVLFDLGDTLVNFGKVRTTRIFLEGARTSYAFLRENGQAVGSFARYFLENLGHIRIRYLISNLTGKDFDALDLLRSIGRKKGTQLSQEQWEHLAWLWYEPLTKVGRVEHDLRETLTTLGRRGLKLGIVSNTFVNRTSLERHLRAVGILDFFSVRMYSYEFDCRKPDRKIFRIAAEKIGEAIGDILFVGDRIEKDIRPALDSGMATALKDAHTNAGKAMPPGAHRIQLLSELPALIESINAEATQPLSRTGSLGAAR